MRYNGDYAESVRGSILSAITNLETCITDSTNITSIPSDFERIQDINNVITGISNIKLADINSEIESAIEEFEVTEKEAKEKAAELAKGSELARYEEAKGKARLDKLLEEKMKYIHENYSNEAQILLEELKAEAQYSHDGSMVGYIEAMNNADVKKVKEVMDNLINKGERTIIDEEIVIAQCIHSYLEENNYEYHACDLNGLYPYFDDSKNSPEEIKNVCCATYVSWVLKELGYINGAGGCCEIPDPNEDTNSDFTSNQYSNMHSANDLNDVFINKEGTYFERVENLDTIKPGDILYYYKDKEHGHIEIYAGNDDSGNWVIFSCGSNAWINYSLPTARDGLGEDRNPRTPTTVWRIIEDPDTSGEDKK